MKRPLGCLTLVLALSCGCAAALAQDNSESIKKTNPVPPMTDTSKPEQGGKQEPGAKVPGTDGDATVFANGVLTASGALTDVDTAPAKFSARTAADDRLATVGYRLKHLSAEHTSAIYQQLAQGTSPSAATANNLAEPVVGGEMPATVVLQDLKPLPGALGEKIPDTRGLSFLRVGDKVVLVDPTMRIIVAVLAR